jgi:hypothetical protein
VFLRSVRQLIVTAKVLPSSPIVVTLMMGALSSSETSVITGATQRKIPQDGILFSNMLVYNREYTNETQIYKTYRQEWHISSNTEAT